MVRIAIKFTVPEIRVNIIAIITSLFFLNTFVHELTIVCVSLKKL